MACHSLTYRHSLHAALRKLLRDCGREDLCRQVHRLTAVRCREVTVPEVEFEAVLRCAPPALELALLLAHEAGLRAATAARFSRANCDFDARAVMGVTKAQNTYRLPMTKRLYDRLLWFCAATRDPDASICQALDDDHKPLTSPRLFAALTKAKQRAGVVGAWALHDLRRTAARRLYDATGDIRKVQSFLGHKMLWTTCWYLGNAIQNLTAADLETSTTTPTQERYIA